VANAAGEKSFMGGISMSIIDQDVADATMEIAIEKEIFHEIAEAFREVAQEIWVENAALKKELRMVKNQRDTYLKELQRKTDLLKQVG